MRPLFDVSRPIGDVIRIADDLLEAGQDSAAGYLVREAAAPLTGSPSLRGVLRWWSGLQEHRAGEKDPETGQQLHQLAHDLADSGYPVEAVRIMTSAMRHVSASDEALESIERAARSSRHGRRPVSEVAEKVERWAVDLLGRGRPEGVTVLSGAARLTERWWRASKYANLLAQNLQPLGRPPSRSVEVVYQPLRSTARHLSWLRHYEPAVNVGLLPVLRSVLGDVDDTSRYWLLPQALKDVPVVRVAAELSRQLYDKGHVGEAAEVFATGVNVSQAGPRDAWLAVSSEVTHESQTAALSEQAGVVTRSLIDGVLGRKSFSFGAPPTGEVWDRLGDEPPTPDHVQPPAFHFTITGDRTVGTAVQCGSDADLAFRYGIPGADTLAVVVGEHLRADGMLELEAMPFGYTLRDGQPRKCAVFQGGRLVEPVCFPLRGDATPRDDAGVNLLFRVDGTVIYELFMALPTVNTLPDYRAAPRRPTINLDDVMAARGRARAYSVTIREHDGGAFEVIAGLPNRPATSRVAKISGAKLQALINEVHALLKEVGESPVFNAATDPLRVPIDATTKPFLDKCVDIVLTAGARLFAALKKDPAFGPALDAIEGLHPGAAIGIWTDTCFLPWALFYPIDFNYENPEHIKAPRRDHQRLWGYRFNIECQLADPENEVRRAPAVYSERAVTMCLNPRIYRGGGAAGPYDPLGTHDTFLADLKVRAIEAEVRRGLTDTLPLFEGPGSAATLLYFYCHGRGAEPFSAVATREGLEMDPDQFIEPTRFVKRRDRFPRQPIVFLNSCDVGAFSPLLFTSFLSAFRENGAEGMIASGFQLPIPFAAACGQEVMRRYLNGKPIGQVLLDLRRELLDRSNPLGLFYALNCALDLYVET